MSLTKRRMEIFNLLQKNKAVEVNELAKRFQVSTMTIRRDLNMLEKQGLAITSYGGARLNMEHNIEPSFSLKSDLLVEYKNEIAVEANRFIQDGDTILIDTGTTPLQLCRYLQNKRIIVLTNSLPAINILQAFSKIQLIVACGQYNDISNGWHSAMTIDFFKQFRIDKAFLGTQGIDHHGAYIAGMEEAQVKKAMMESARQSFLLCDHTKFNQTLLAKYAPLTDFDCIITDSQLDRVLYDEYSKIIPLISSSRSYQPRK